MKILYIQPDSIGLSNPHFQALADEVTLPGNTIEVTNLDYQPPTMNLPKEPIYLQALFARIKRARREGVDGVVIGCYADPGQRDADLSVSMPVFGAFQLGGHMASLRGKCVGVLCPATIEGRRHRSYSWHKENLYGYGLRPEMFLFKNVPLPRPQKEEVESYVSSGQGEEVVKMVHNIHRESITGEALKVARQLVNEGANVILPACTLWGGMGHQLEEQLGIPVIDSVYSILLLAQTQLMAQKKPM